MNTFNEVSSVLYSRKFFAAFSLFIQNCGTLIIMGLITFFCFCRLAFAVVGDNLPEKFHYVLSAEHFQKNFSGFFVCFFVFQAPDSSSLCISKLIRLL